MLSVRIEQLMIPEVVLTQADESEPSPHIALDSLFFDDTGMHLYRPREGSGWETGTRIYEEEINNAYADRLKRLQREGTEFLMGAE